MNTEIRKMKYEKWDKTISQRGAWVYHIPYSIFYIPATERSMHHG